MPARRPRTPPARTSSPRSGSRPTSPATTPCPRASRCARATSAPNDEKPRATDARDRNYARIVRSDPFPARSRPARRSRRADKAGAIGSIFAPAVDSPASWQQTGSVHGHPRAPAHLRPSLPRRHRRVTPPTSSSRTTAPSRSTASTPCALTSAASCPGTRLRTSSSAPATAPSTTTRVR